eukprot:m.441805 g.441805  ORF g.441805 m.441805 type:complete len:112 (+) comp20283_c2_seq5:5291-5626(+)
MMAEWYNHGFMSTDDADALLQGKPDGTFLIWEDGGIGGAGYILSVVDNSRTTHHRLDAKGGKFMLDNKQPLEDTLEKSINHLRQKRPYWPVPLNEYIPPQTVSSKNHHKEY